MLDQILPWLLAGFLIVFAAGALRRIAMWRAGRPQKVDLIAGLLAMPRRYLVDLHHVVDRDKAMSHTHVATAGGFVASLLLVILVHGFGLDNVWLARALMLTTALMFIGALFVFRRRINPPSRLSKGPWMRLPKSLITFSVTFFIVTLPAAGILPDGFGSGVLAIILLAGIIFGSGEMLFGMGWGGPMKHAFAGALHLAFHRRPERFGGGRSTGLKAVNLDDESLGVAKPSDFKWNQLLGFDACVQCGRCEAMCPAFAAGQPLNPKKLIQDMVVGLAGGSDAKFAGSPYPGIEVGNASGGPDQTITEGLVAPETLWSCTTCRACVEECPMMIEHVDAIVDMRRFLTMEKGNTPNKGAETLENLIATDNPGGNDPGSRMHWAADQNLNLMSDVKAADVLFWVGDGAFDMRSQRILRAFVKIMKQAGVDFAVLGNEERDVGDVARRLGDDATFQSLAKHNIATMKKYGFKRIVTTDPHAFHCLNNEYGELGGDFEVLHHSTFINELLTTGALNVSAYKGGAVTYHDPCYLGRANNIYEIPRDILKKLDAELLEMKSCKSKGLCCGAGGAQMFKEPEKGNEDVKDIRIKQALETNPDIIAAACPFCNTMLSDGLKAKVSDESTTVMDISQIIEKAKGL